MDIPQSGFEQYIASNFDFAEDFVRNVTLPDFSLEIAGFKIIFRDMKLSNMQFPRTKAQFMQDFCNFALYNMNITFVFQFEVLQQSYPYIQDKGNGTIDLKNLRATLTMFLKGDCPYHVSLGMQNTDIVI